MTPIWAVPVTDGCDIAHHEDVMRDLMDGLFPDGGVLVDVGAHMGLWSVTLGLRASRVFAVEPNPETVAVLRQNITLNHLDGVVEVVEAAAWDSDGECGLLAPDGHGHDLRTGWMRTVPDGTGVVARRLDSVLVTGRLDLVKVDTEGSDLRALRGMAGLLAAHRPVVVVESHQNLPYGYEASELTATVEDLGYGWEWGPAWNGTPYLICRWPQ